MNLLEILQQINDQANSARQPTDMVVGTVTSLDPIEITTDIHQAALREEVLIFTDSIGGGNNYTVTGKLLKISKFDSGTGFSLGDKVLMLSVMHGQSFIVLSKM